MKRILTLIGLVATLALTGCAGPNLITKQQAFPAVYAEHPVSVLVVPAINHSTAATAPDYYSVTIAEPLARLGYYVLPIELTTQILREAGIDDGEQLKDVPPERFGQSFGADAVLYVTIDEWDTSYYVVGGNVTVGIEFQMKSTKTGESLWHYHDRVKVDTSGSSNSGGLIGAIIETAIKTSMQDYMPVAQRVNAQAIYTMPCGKYSECYDKDQQAKVVFADKLAQQ